MQRRDTNKQNWEMEFQRKSSVAKGAGVTRYEVCSVDVQKHGSL